MDVEGLRRPEEVRRDLFTQLTTASRKVLQGVAMRYCCSDRAAAEDLLQDTYERAWRNLDSLHDGSKAIAWLITIMRNCWIDTCRKRVRQHHVSDVPDQPTIVEEQSLWQRITVQDFHHAVEQLEEPYRSVVIMHDIDHLSNADIAQRLNAPYGTVATRLHRARKQLQRLLRAAVNGPE